jgi:predicted transcriptional regulator
MKPASTVPTDPELLDLSRQRKIAYTTVLTMMGVLERKGYLTKEPGERAYIYSPAVSQEEMVRKMVDEFIGRVFNGAAQPLLVHLAGDQRIAASELAEVEKIVRARRKAGRHTGIQSQDRRIARAALHTVR